VTPHPTRPSADGLMTAPVASHPLPSEREKHVLGAQARVPSACGGPPRKKNLFLLPGRLFQNWQNHLFLNVYSMTYAVQTSKMPSFETASRGEGAEVRSG